MNILFSVTTQSVCCRRGYVRLVLMMNVAQFHTVIDVYVSFSDLSCEPADQLLMWGKSQAIGCCQSKIPIFHKVV